MTNLLRSGEWDAGDAASAGWQLLSFRVVRSTGARRFETGEEEVAIVLLSGDVTVDADGRRVGVGGRRERLRGAAPVALPPARHARRARGRARELALCGARADDGASRVRDPARGRRDRGARLRATRRGRSRTSSSPTSRPSGSSSSRCYTPSGNWSSYPPHKHDEERGAERGRPRGDVLLPNRRRPGGVRRAAALQPAARARPDGDGARRRPAARPVRLPHDRGRARLRPLLPERARRRPAHDAVRRRPGARVDPPAWTSSSRTRECRWSSSGLPARARRRRTHGRDPRARARTSRTVEIACVVEPSETRRRGGRCPTGDARCAARGRRRSRLPCRLVSTSRSSHGSPGTACRSSARSRAGSRAAKRARSRRSARGSRSRTGAGSCRRSGAARATARRRARRPPSSCPARSSTSCRLHAASAILARAAGSSWTWASTSSTSCGG